MKTFIIDYTTINSLLYKHQHREERDMEHWTACAFTGHRPADLPARGQEDAPPALALKARLGETIDEMIARGVRRFYCGGALGFDTWAAEAVLERKGRIPHISLYLILPYWGQESRWQAQDQLRYRKIVGQADVTRFLAPGYHTRCMHQRNRALVDEADVVVGYCVKNSGGTAYTLAYARRQGKPVVLLSDSLRQSTLGL
jgi:uncharacterized phage-like protein YoqJ